MPNLEREGPSSQETDLRFTPMNIITLSKIGTDGKITNSHGICVMLIVKMLMQINWIICIWDKHTVPGIQLTGWKGMPT